MEKRYSNGDITVVWCSDKCIHAARCVTGLPAVFNATARPWVDMSGASTEDIKRVVDTCPSGALTWEAGASSVEK